MEKLCGLEVSSAQVSRLTAELDGTFELWRKRPLPPIAHMIIDATYIKVRIGGSVRDCAVFTAIGVRRDDGKRMILGVSAALSEAEVHWRTFLVSLKERGIGIPDSITSDAHEGIKAALRAVFNATPWQRCQFHLQQNAQAYVPKVDMREAVGADIRTVFNAPDLAHAEEQLDSIVEKYSKSAPELSAWMQRLFQRDLRSSIYRSIRGNGCAPQMHVRLSTLRSNAEQRLLDFFQIQTRFSGSLLQYSWKSQRNGRLEKPISKNK